ncbi:hypothetical protein [Spiroplasma endosymbiont of Cantharis nigra]|uniref:hypothetical protein n=1 Tax=Spiroplasma endosymbiont of Cantharis nigra TaxID=3066278 RepID=UPI0030D235B8
MSSLWLSDSGYASSIGSPVVEQYLVITLGFDDEPKYKEFTKRWWNRTSAEPTLKFGSSFCTDKSNEQGFVYKYYEEVKGDVNNIESARKYSNDLWVFRIGLVGYSVKAGTLWSYNEIEKLFRLHFIFYTKVWINGGSLIIPYFSNLDWDLGNSLTIIRE